MENSTPVYYKTVKDIEKYHYIAESSCAKSYRNRINNFGCVEFLVFTYKHTNKFFPLMYWSQYNMKRVQSFKIQNSWFQALMCLLGSQC